MQPEILIAICVAVVIVFALLMGILSRYRKCPSDKILVIYGKVGSDKNGQARSAKCVHGGAAFIMPIIQSYQFMDLTPISINVDLKNALSKQNIRERDTGACKGYHIRSVTSCSCYYGDRGDKQRP